MPMAAPAALVPVIAFFSTPVIGGLTIGTIVGTVALSGASFLINKALAPKAKGFGGGIDEGVKQIVQQAVPSQRLILGKALVGGPMFFYEVKPPYLYIGVVLASHEIDAVEKIYINGTEVQFDGAGTVTTEDFVDAGTPLIYASVRLGSATQAQDPIIAADFPELAADTAWRQKGHATIVLKCDYGGTAENHNDFWGTSAPQFLFLVRGAKVFNPLDATQSASDPSTWRWSDNASLCLAWYLTHAKGGALPWSSIDIDALKVAAAHDNESIALASGAWEPRYTVNGVINLDSEVAENVFNLLTANLGRLVWSEGSYRILSGVPREATWTLNDDSARGEMAVRMHRDRAGLVNTVRTVFAAPDREYQTANGPVLVNDDYVTADGQSHEITITLPFTASHTMAQRIAKATMEKARLGKLITRRENLEAIRLNAGDIVNIEVGFLSVLGGTFEINACKLDHDRFEVEITAEEYAASIYDWSTADEQAFTISPADLAGVN
jgi:hypothetical protein